MIRNIGNTTELITDGEVVETHEGDPFEFIRSYMDRFNVLIAQAFHALLVVWLVTLVTMQYAIWSLA